MSIYHITDITPAGAYLNAMNAMSESESHARRHVKKPEGPGFLARLGRGFNAALELAGKLVPRWPGRTPARNAPEPAE